MYRKETVICFNKIYFLIINFIKFFYQLIGLLSQLENKNYHIILGYTCP